MVITGFIGFTNYVVPEKQWFGEPKGAGFGSDSIDDFGGGGRIPGMVCGCIALLMSYPVLNIELYAALLPKTGLNKIRLIHFSVLDGSINGEAKPTPSQPTVHPQHLGCGMGHCHCFAVQAPSPASVPHPPLWNLLGAD